MRGIDVANPTDAQRIHTAADYAIWRADLNGVCVEAMVGDPTLELHAEGIVANGQMGARLVDNEGRVYAEQVQVVP